MTEKSNFLCDFLGHKVFGILRKGDVPTYDETAAEDLKLSRRDRMARHQTRPLLHTTRRLYGVVPEFAPEVQHGERGLLIPGWRYSRQVSPCALISVQVYGRWDRSLGFAEYPGGVL